MLFLVVRTFETPTNPEKRGRLSLWVPQIWKYYRFVGITGFFLYLKRKLLSPTHFFCAGDNTNRELKQTDPETSSGWQDDNRIVWSGDSMIEPTVVIPNSQLSFRTRFGIFFTTLKNSDEPFKKSLEANHIKRPCGCPQPVEVGSYEVRNTKYEVQRHIPRSGTVCAIDNILQLRHRPEWTGKNVYATFHTSYFAIRKLH